MCQLCLILQVYNYKNFAVKLKVKIFQNFFNIYNESGQVLIYVDYFLCWNGDIFENHVFKFCFDIQEHVNKQSTCQYLKIKIF